MAGDLRPDEGRIRLRRSRHHPTAPPTVDAGSASAARRRYHGRSTGLTVFENVLVGRHVRRRRAPRAPQRGGAPSRPLELAGMARPGQRAGRLAHPARPQAPRAGPGPRHRGPRSCCSTRSPAASPRPRCTSWWRRIRPSTPTGVSIVWIEHIVHALLSVVDRMLAMDYGRKLIEGDPQRGDVVGARCATSTSAPTPSRWSCRRRRHRALLSRSGVGHGLLEVEALDAGYGAVPGPVRRRAWTSGEGEAVAIIGANGAGKSTLLKAMVGLGPGRRRRGALRRSLAGRRADPPPRGRTASSLVPEGRRIFPSLSVEENLADRRATAGGPGRGPRTPSLRRLPAAGSAWRAGRRRGCRAASSRPSPSAGR